MALRNLSFLVALLLSAIECCSGQQALPPGPVTGMVTGNVTFRTTVLDSPVQQFLTITWTFNNGGGPKPVVTSLPNIQKIAPEYSGRVMVNTTTGSLQLLKLTLGDSGNYAVNMVTQDGQTLTGETTLNVYEPISGVTVKANVTSPVEFNDTVSVKCDAAGSQLFFKWLNGSSEISGGSRLSLSDGNRTLTISNILRSDSGPLCCVVSNALMTTRSQNITFDVCYGPDDVVMTTVPQSNLYTSGSNLTLSCSAVSVPPAQFHWAFNGNMLQQEGPQLRLDNILDSQSGNYTCWAYNSKTLQYKPSGLSHITIMQKISGANITGPSALIIADNSSANMTCQATAGIIDSREWLKDGKTLSPSNTVTISADKSSVFIKPVRVSDGGDYLCKLINRVSTANATYKLNVNYGPLKVTVVGKPTVKEGTRVELKCSAESVPTAVFSWAFNGTVRNVKTPEFIIEHAVFGDTGRYTCMASNSVTGINASSVYLLSVKEQDSPPEQLSSGAIVGIVIGVLLAVVLIVVVVKKLMKRRNFHQLDMCAGPSKTIERIESPY